MESTQKWPPVLQNDAAICDCFVLLYQRNPRPSAVNTQIFIVKIGKISVNFRPKAQVAQNKNKKS
jgi:hypothetical protein